MFATLEHLVLLLPSHSGRCDGGFFTQISQKKQPCVLKSLTTQKAGCHAFTFIFVIYEVRLTLTKFGPCLYCFETLKMIVSTPKANISALFVQQRSCCFHLHRFNPAKTAHDTSRKKGTLR